MRKFVLAVALLSVLTGLSSVHAEGPTARIVYAAKMPTLTANEAGVGGLAELAGLVEDVRRESEYSLFLHGGDSLAPSGLSSFDHGTHMVDILNLIDPAGFAINEREFAYKEDELVLRVREARFPFVSSNIYDPLTGGNLSGVEDSLLVEVGGRNIGVLSILDPGVLTAYLPDRIEVRNPYDAIRSGARELRNRGAEAVVVMSSYSIEGSRSLLADGTVDLILESSSDEDTIQTVGNGILARQGTDEGNALLLDLTFGTQSGERPRISGEVVPLNRYSRDPEVVAKIEYYQELLAGFLDVPVGTTDTPLDTTKSAVRTEENAFGNLVADAVREYYEADIGLVNSGGIRGNRRYSPGKELTRRDIQGELPFHNEVRLITVSGDQILAALENSVSLYEEEKGRFLQVSGMTVEYCVSNPVGERVRSVRIGNRRLRRGREYALATLDYLIEGGDGYDMFAAAAPIRTPKSSLLLWEIVRRYVERAGNVEPQVEGRLVVDCR